MTVSDASGTGVVIQPIASADLPEVFDLYRRTVSFPPADRIAEYWHWKFGANPFQEPGAPAFWVGRRDATLVGCLGQMPVVLHIGSRPVPAAWAVDFMIDPRFQRQGFGTRIFDHFRRSNDVAMSIGNAPGTATSKVSRAVGFTALPAVPNLFKPLTTRPFTADLPLGPLWGPALARLSAPVLRRLGRLRSRPATPLRLQELSRFPESFDALWAMVTAETTVAVRRDHAVMNWRYVDNPFQRYRVLAALDGTSLVGCVVFKAVPHELFNFGTIAEIIAPAAAVDVQRHLLLGAIEVLEGERVDIVKSLATAPHLVHLLRHAGFLALGPGCDFVASAAPSVAPDLAATVVDPGAWYLTKGDSDLDIVPDFLTKLHRTS